MIQFAIELERKHAAIPVGIPAMCVHSAFTIFDPALVGNHKSSIIIHFTLSNVVPEIGFSDLVARVELNANKKGASSDVGTINPLTVNLGTVNIETPWRYSLITAPSAIPPLFKTRVTLCVL